MRPPIAALIAALVIAASVMTSPTAPAHHHAWPVPASTVPAHAPYDTTGGLLWDIYRRSA